MKENKNYDWPVSKDVLEHMTEDDIDGMLTESRQKISVAVLTYNRYKTAIRTIKSIISDPYVKDIVIFDDCSNKVDICNIRSYCSKYNNITIKENKINLGHHDNFKLALLHLSMQDVDMVFLCESDMLLSKGWGNATLQAFYRSKDSVALSMMLHRDQLSKNRSIIFKNRCLTGEDSRYPETKGRTPFGSKCYTTLPDSEKVIVFGKYKIRFISNSVGTFVFKRSALKEICSHINVFDKFEHQTDAWISYMCFSVNKYNSRSLMVLDPGLARTFGEPGLHGMMHVNNVRWSGSFFWRSTFASFITRPYYYMLIFFIKIKKIGAEYKKNN